MVRVVTFLKSLISMTLKSAKLMTEYLYQVRMVLKNWALFRHWLRQTPQARESVTIGVKLEEAFSTLTGIIKEIS